MIYIKSKLIKGNWYWWMKTQKKEIEKKGNKVRMIKKPIRGDGGKRKRRADFGNTSLPLTFFIFIFI